MQMCPNCENVYDESEEPFCPYCHDGEPEDYYVKPRRDWPAEDEDDDASGKGEEPRRGRGLLSFLKKR